MSNFTIPQDATAADVAELLRGNKITAAQFAAWVASAKTRKPLSVKMSDKGCVSVYGLNAQFPTSLYPDQWERLFAFTDSIRQFIDSHRAELDRRGEASRAAKRAA